MLPGTSTKNDGNTPSAGKVSADIIVLFSILVAIVILPPFIIAATILYKNRRRPTKKISISYPILSTLESTLHSNHGHHNIRAKVSPPPPPAVSKPDRFKPLPLLPHVTPLSLPQILIPPRSSSCPPSSALPSLPVPSLARPDPQTWRTSNPHISTCAPNISQDNRTSMISLISQCSSTYADVDLSDSPAPISPLSPRTSPRSHFQLHQYHLNPHPSHYHEKDVGNVKIDNQIPHGILKPSESSWEMRPLGTRVIRDIRGVGSNGYRNIARKDKKVEFVEDSSKADELFFDFVRKGRGMGE